MKTPALALTLATLLATSQMAVAAAPVAAPAAPGLNASHVKDTVSLLEAMQAEKMMRSVAGYSRYGSEAQRTAVFDKLNKVPAGVIHQRLSVPVSRVLSPKTVVEMTRFYNSSFGQKVLTATYNSKPSMFAQQAPQATKEERKIINRPEYLAANKEFEAAEPKIRHEAFKLLQVLSK